MENEINAVRVKAAEIELLADVLENLKDRKNWYMHRDEETGELVPDDNDRARAFLSACDNIAKAIRKLAGA